MINKVSHYFDNKIVGKIICNIKIIVKVCHLTLYGINQFDH